MNEEIIKLNNDTYVKTDEGTYKVNNDEDLESTLELENYIEYLEGIIDLISEELSKRDFSNMSLKEIIVHIKKDKSVKMLCNVMNLYFILTSLIMLINLITSGFVFGSAMLVAVLPLAVPGALRFYAASEKDYDIKRKEKLSDVKKLLEEYNEKLSKMKNIVKEEVKEVKFTHLNTYDRCIYSGFIPYEEDKEQTFTRKRKL